MTDDDPDLELEREMERVRSRSVTLAVVAVMAAVVVVCLSFVALAGVAMTVDGGSAEGMRDAVTYFFGGGD